MLSPFIRLPGNAAPSWQTCHRRGRERVAPKCHHLSRHVHRRAPKNKPSAPDFPCTVTNYCAATKTTCGSTPTNATETTRKKYDGTRRSKGVAPPLDPARLDEGSEFRVRSELLRFAVLWCCTPGRARRFSFGCINRAGSNFFFKKSANHE